MSRWLWSVLPLLVVVAGVVDSDSAEACGPGFPPSLLLDREQALQAPLNEPFVAQVMHLVDGLVPADPPYVAVVGEPDGVRDRGGEQERALYARGAVAFEANDLEGARAAFVELLALPAEQRHQRGTWAAFMLGRLGEEGRYAEVRRLVDDGFADELGLATASFGQQAREHLPSHHLIGSAVPIDENTALQFYGRQARLDREGATSLLHMVRDILDDGGDRLAHVASSVVGQRLLVTYAATRADERPINVGKALELLAKNDDCAWPDQLAAALYKQGRIDDATRFVAKAPTTPLGLWVRARLAMRKGDLDDARSLLAQASTAFPVVPAEAGPEQDEEGWAYWYYDGSDEVSGHRRLVGEQGVLALARGEYVFALERLLQEEVWWRDAAFVAEKVLTVDELKNFVATHPQWSAPAKQNRPSLRALLARRLARSDRLVEAADYVDNANTLLAVRRLEALHADEALDLADLPATVRRAARLFAESQILRTSGLEVLGTELGPDWSIFGGYYEPWDEQNLDDNGDPLPPQPASPLASADEQQRVKDAAPVPNRRFHYRATAISRAEEAAALVPPRSQAYAAILCEATHHANGRDSEVQRLWKQYVQRGAIVDFTGAFGSSLPCPPPDFATLAAADRKQQLKLWLGGGAAAIAFVFAVIAVLSSRRRR